MPRNSGADCPASPTSSANTGRSVDLHTPTNADVQLQPRPGRTYPTSHIVLAYRRTWAGHRHSDDPWVHGHHDGAPDLVLLVLRGRRHCDELDSRLRSLTVGHSYLCEQRPIRGA